MFWCEGFLQFLDLLITFKDIWRVWDKRILVPQGFCLKKSISFEGLKWTSLCQSFSSVQNFLSSVDLDLAIVIHISMDVNMVSNLSTTQVPVR